jgi:hypothetical protein
MSIPAKQIGWSNKSNLLYEVLKQLNKLNKQICCDINNTTSTTSSTTTTLTFTRKSFLLSLDSSLRQGFVAQRNGWYNGNTVASIGASNPNFVYMAIVGNEATGGATTRQTRYFKETSVSPTQIVNPTYTTVDGVTGANILTSVKDKYQFAVKIVNNTFLSTRNPVVFVKRVISTSGFGSGIPNDGAFLVGIEFDATGNEYEGYNYLYQAYNQVNFPGTITLPFPYNSYYGGQINVNNTNFPMGLYSPASSWVNGVTTLPAFGIIIQEDFPIPPGW